MSSNLEVFELIVVPSTWPLYKYTEYDLCEYFIGNPTHSCLFVSIEDSTAILHGLYYDPVHTHDHDPVTLHLVQGSLKYILRMHPWVRRVLVMDHVEMLESIHVTPRRLLRGEKGWYEEYFGAEATERTCQKLKYIRERVPILPKSTCDEWGKRQDIETAMLLYAPYSQYLISKIYGTTWTISRDTIRKYPIIFECKRVPHTDLSLANDAKKYH